ncbi:MAG: DUF4435 domain-containing protein [Rikenellaceae bacterium]|jgi:hypothetical protein|nr:DUF4435 domain-containing protein [Rikenellaceae bacterium]
MARLTDSFSSKYFDAASTLKGTKYQLVRVFVEGYNDVAFWRGVLDPYENDRLKFEISVPVRQDLAKGKKVVLKFLPQSGKNLILCVDSDFDYLFGDFSEQSQAVNGERYLFQTYAYATENFVCYPPSLHALCVKATKNDRMIFDFEQFFADYSKIIYPVFLRYALSARNSSQNSFTLNDFKNTVRINYLDLRENGRYTLEWLQRQVDKRLAILDRRRRRGVETPQAQAFERQIQQRGVTEENVFYFMQGHTLRDNVALPVLEVVCNQLRELTNRMIADSTREGVSLRNELSNYNNSLRPIEELLDDNSGYKKCFLYEYLAYDIYQYVCRDFPDTQDNLDTRSELIGKPSFNKSTAP